MNRQRRVKFCGRRRGNEAAYSGSVDLMYGMRATGVANFFGKMRMQPVASLQNPPAHENKIEQAVLDRSSTRDLTTQSSYFPKQKHAGSSSPAYIAGASDALPGEIEQTRLQCARNNFINKIDVTKAESATTESMTSKEYKDGRSSDNVPWIDEEKCAEGMVPMDRKHQRKGGNVDELSIFFGNRKKADLCPLA